MELSRVRASGLTPSPTPERVDPTMHCNRRCCHVNAVQNGSGFRVSGCLVDFYLANSGKLRSTVGRRRSQRPAWVPLFAFSTRRDCCAAVLFHEDRAPVRHVGDFLSGKRGTAIYPTVSRRRIPQIRNAIPAMPAMIGNMRCPAIAPAWR
jgi:hypothetical protein